MPAEPFHGLRDGSAVIFRRIPAPAALLPQDLNVGGFSPNTGAAHKALEKSHIDIRNLDKKFKDANDRYTQGPRLEAFQRKMTGAVGDSGEALLDIVPASRVPEMLVASGEKTTAAYLDLCEARKHLLTLR